MNAQTEKSELKTALTQSLEYALLKNTQRVEGMIENLHFTLKHIDLSAAAREKIEELLTTTELLQYTTAKSARIYDTLKNNFQ